MNYFIYFTSHILFFALSVLSFFNEFSSFHYHAYSPHVRDSGFRNPGNVCLWNPESWVLESGIQLKVSGIPLTIGIQNPSSTDKYWNPVSGIQNPRLSWILLLGATHTVNFIDTIPFLLLLRWILFYHNRHPTSRWSVTSLRGPGQRNFNAVSHKPTHAPIQFNLFPSALVYGIRH